MNLNVPAFLLAVRLTENLTLAEVGARLEVGRQAVSRWERGIRLPRRQTLAKMQQQFPKVYEQYESL